jgi:MFS family permease
VEHGFTIALIIIGFGGIPSDKPGRRQTLAWIAVLDLVSALGAALTNSWPLLIVFRLLGGLRVGASSVTAPLYIAELTPPAPRDFYLQQFGSMMVLQLLFVWRFMPETKGTTLEQIDKALVVH